MAHYELHAWCLLVLAWVMVPFYMRSRVYTMPEFLERRFGPANRWMLSLISLVAYVLTRIAVGIFSGGVVFSVMLPEFKLGPLDSFWLGSILVIVLTGVYTILGGLRAVVYSEVIRSSPENHGDRHLPSPLCHLGGNTTPFTLLLLLIIRQMAPVSNQSCAKEC